MAKGKKPIDAIAQVKAYYDKKREAATSTAYQQRWATRTYNHVNDDEPKPTQRVSLPKLKWMDKS